MKTADEHIWAVGEIASYNGGMCYQLSAPGKSWDGGCFTVMVGHLLELALWFLLNFPRGCILLVNDL